MNLSQRGTAIGAGNADPQNPPLKLIWLIRKGERKQVKVEELKKYQRQGWTFWAKPRVKK